jgi:hypothetical protein
MQKIVKTMVVMLVTALSASLAAAPVGYSINSDSPSGNADGLYRIDLLTGVGTRIGTVPPVGLPRIDIEGLAFAPNGTLYGVDDDSLKLFPLDVSNASVIAEGDVPISGLPSGGQNDFGMTFACDGTLYITTVIERSLYRMDLDGTAHLIGDLGHNISAIAAYGNNPVKLYGLGNGLDKNRDIDSPSLFGINLQTGAATEIGALNQGGITLVGDYTEGGLAFDDDGQLWAITDRAQLLTPFPSQVMKVDKGNGLASEVKNTSEFGFESLAISVPKGCATVGSGQHAEFVVQSRFTDGNNITPVKLNIKCNTGSPLDQSLTVYPDDGAFGKFEVKFIVDAFPDGALDCEVWQDPPTGYSTEYDCEANTGCEVNQGVGPCQYEDVRIGETNHCLIQSIVDPVDLTVTKQWQYERDDPSIDNIVRIDLNCINVTGGDGLYDSGSMSWNWLFEGAIDQNTASVQPAFDGSTQCWAEERALSSAIEVENGCAGPITINTGDEPHACTVTNTVFYEGIPTLGSLGLWIFSALMLLTGLLATRRF